jgi:hypothetical protein
MVRAWHGHGMASVNQTRPHGVNQMGKTHSKHLAARHDRGPAWARHAMCESALRDDQGFAAVCSLVCTEQQNADRNTYECNLYDVPRSEERRVGKECRP